LDKVFAEEETARAEVRAGAYPFPYVQLIFVIQRHRDRRFGSLLPSMFESFSPRRELAISACVIHHLIKFPIVARGQLDDEDPDQ
jgi:hypothetical protein